MNKNLFNTQSPVTSPLANARNEAGGLAYSLSDQEALTQLVVTGTFQNTFYSSGSEQLGKVLELAKKCDPVFVAKLAVYARTQAFMKDAPAVLTAYLSTVDGELFKTVFAKVINNGNMLRKFISVMRSGTVGRKSLGNLPKKMVQKLLNGRGEEWLFRNSIGNEPSMGDVIKMVHPKAKNASVNNMFAYLLDRKYDASMLPDVVNSYEDFKKDNTGKMPPAVDFRLLSNIKMSPDQWAYILKSMSWTTLRMNLNMLMRNGVFESSDAVKYAAKTLMNKEEIVAAKVFPFQIYNTIRNTTGLPSEIQKALGVALEVSLVNTPVFEGSTLVALDISPSMGGTATGENGSATSTVTCYDVAMLFAGALLAKNTSAEIVTFDTQARFVKLPSRELNGVLNTLKNLRGGGTEVASVLQLVNSGRNRFDNIIVISDNQSWVQSVGTGYGYQGRGGLVSPLMAAFEVYKKNVNSGTKLVLWDVAPYATTVAPSKVNEVLNVGGYSDSVFSVLEGFINGGGFKTLTEKIEAVSLVQSES